MGGPPQRTSPRPPGQPKLAGCGGQVPPSVPPLGPPQTQVEGVHAGKAFGKSSFHQRSHTGTASSVAIELDREVQRSPWRGSGHDSRGRRARLRGRGPAAPSIAAALSRALRSRDRWARPPTGLSHSRPRRDHLRRVTMRRTPGAVSECFADVCVLGQQRNTIALLTTQCGRDGGDRFTEKVVDAACRYCLDPAKLRYRITHHTCSPRWEYQKRLRTLLAEVAMKPSHSVAPKTATRTAVITILAATASWVPSCATETNTPPTTSSSVSSTTRTTTQPTSSAITVYRPPPLTTGTPPTTSVTTPVPQTPRPSPTPTTTTATTGKPPPPPPSVTSTPVPSS